MLNEPSSDVPDPISPPPPTPPPKDSKFQPEPFASVTTDFPANTSNMPTLQFNFTDFLEYTEPVPRSVTPPAVQSPTKDSQLFPPSARLQRRASSPILRRDPRQERDDLLPTPPPPLLRPTTFWKNTPRTALSGPSYSPSSHLIRRSTFVAAGLDFEQPVSDLSALCVETRGPVVNVFLPPEVPQGPAR